MLNPEERTQTLETLRPPLGYELDCAIATTFSLDLIALLTAPLAFTLFDWEDQEGQQIADPLAILESLRRYAERISIFCQSGHIAVPKHSQQLFSHLEESIFQVSLDSGVFHAKTWVLRFTSKDEPVIYRVIVPNPVDLEQREGRVHRYKGHAVRKNVAKSVFPLNAAKNGSDPWQEMFEIAKRGRASTRSDIVPFWVYQINGGAQIERHVLSFPLSKEDEQLELLKRALVVYRMVFGQSRQEDLTRYLLDHLSSADINRIADEMRITLEPA